MGARAVGPWVGEQKPLGKTSLRGNPSPERTCLPTSLRNIRRGTTPTTAVLASWSLNQDQLPCDWLLTIVRSTRKPKTTQGVFPISKTPWSVLPNAGTKPKWTNAVVSGRLT